MSHQDACDFYIARVRDAWKPNNTGKVTADCLFWMCSGDTPKNTRSTALMPPNWSFEEVAELMRNRVAEWEAAGRAVTPDCPGQEFVSGAVRGFAALLATEVLAHRVKLDAYPILACMHPDGAFDVGYLTWKGRTEDKAIATLRASLSVCA
jgi:hypothetical protein